MKKLIFLIITLFLLNSNNSYSQLITAQGIFKFNIKDLLIIKQKKYENKLKIKNFKINSIDQNDIYKLIINYNDNSLLIFHTLADPLEVGPFIQLPLNIIINNEHKSVFHLVGKTINQLKYLIEIGSIYILEIDNFLPTYQFNIIVEIDDNTPTIFIPLLYSKQSLLKKIKIVEFKGFIYFIDSDESTITVKKEGVLLTINIISDTVILINGVPATFLNLQLGQKVKLKYDFNTKNVFELSAAFKF